MHSLESGPALVQPAHYPDGVSGRGLVRRRPPSTRAIAPSSNLCRPVAPASQVPPEPMLVPSLPGAHHPNGCVLQGMAETHLRSVITGLFAGCLTQSAKSPHKVETPKLPESRGNRITCQSFWVFVGGITT